MKYLTKVPAVLVFLTACLSIICVIVLSLVWHFDNDKARDIGEDYMDVLDNTLLIKWTENQLRGS